MNKQAEKHVALTLRHAGEAKARPRWDGWKTSTQRCDWHSMTKLEQLAYVALRDAGLPHAAAVRTISEVSTDHNDEYGDLVDGYVQ